MFVFINTSATKYTVASLIYAMAKHISNKPVIEKYQFFTGIVSKSVYSLSGTWNRRDGTDWNSVHQDERGNQSYQGGVP